MKNSQIKCACAIYISLWVDRWNETDYCAPPNSTVLQEHKDMRYLK